METSAAPQKRPRSNGPSSPTPRSATADVSNAASEAAWTAVKETFAVAQWRRGCLTLPIKTTLSSSQSTPAAKAGTSTSIDVTTRYIAPNPWKVLRGMGKEEGLSSGVGVYSSAAAAAPPVPVPPSQWNAYWEAYSVNCGEELESLAAFLKTRTTSFRRVLVTMVSPSVEEPTTETGVAAGVLDSNSGAPWCPAEACDGVLSCNAVDQPPLSIFCDLQRDASEPAVASGAERSTRTSSRSGSPASTHGDDAAQKGKTSPRTMTASAASGGSHSTAFSSSSYSYSSYSSYNSSRGSRSASQASSTGTAAADFPALSSVLDDFVFAHAHHFGAVESIQTYPCPPGCVGSDGRPQLALVSVQFTTAEAAGLFYRWADGLAMQELVESYWQQRQAARPTQEPATSEKRKGTERRGRSPGEQQQTDVEATALAAAEEDAWWSALCQRVSEGQQELAAALIMHDEQLVSGTLLLGPHVMVFTPLVTSLFTGLFCAMNVEYSRSTRGFVITFPDLDESRLALHALQCSLWTHFRLPLSYYSPPA